MSHRLNPGVRLFGELIALDYLAGKSLKAIAAEYDCSRTFVRSALRAVGVPMRPRGRPTMQTDPASIVRANDMAERYRRGETLKMIGAAHRVSREYARQILRACGVPVRRTRGKATGRTSCVKKAERLSRVDLP